MQPSQVAPGDRLLRRHVRRVLFLAYLYAPSTVILTTTTLTILFLIWWPVLGARDSLLAICCFLPVFWLLVPTIGAVLVADRHVHLTDHRVLFLQTPKAASAVVVMPDHRTGTQAGDHLVAVLGAWPKGEGAGTDLGLAVRDTLHAEGNRLTATALWLHAPIYESRGDLVRIPTPRLWPSRLLVRLASQPDQPSPP